MTHTYNRQPHKFRQQKTDRQTDWKPHKTQMSNETLWCLVVNFSMFIFLSMRCAFKQCCLVSDQCDEISPLWRINLGIPGNYQLDYNKREFSRKVAFHQLRHFLFLYKIKNSGYLYWSLWSKPGHSPLLGRGPSFLGCFRFQTWTIMIIALGHSPFSRCQPPPLSGVLKIFTFAGVSPPFFGVLEMSTVLLLCLIPISEICWSNGSLKGLGVRINA